ncbi:MAG: helix-turn-helix domain-containing protein, partial [Candidatus Adiutrix sp.]
NRLKAEEIIVAIELADLRKRQGISQKQMAERLNVQAPAISKAENRPDLHISTLREHIEALGGELDLIARVPGELIKLQSLSSSHKN